VPGWSFYVASYFSFYILVSGLYCKNIFWGIVLLLVDYLLLKYLLFLLRYIKISVNYDCICDFCFYLKHFLIFI
jgi:hypothetical protein